MLSCLVETPDLGEAAWCDRFNAMVSANGTYFPIVIISKETDQIVAMGTIVVELKFFRGLTRVGHVEDIVVNTKLHSEGLGKIVVQTVMNIAESKGCSNIILNCSDEKKRKCRPIALSGPRGSLADILWHILAFALGLRCDSVLRKVRILIQRPAGGQEDLLNPFCSTESRMQNLRKRKQVWTLSVRFSWC